MLIKDLYANGRAVVSFEVFPPKKDSDVLSIYNALKEMSGFKPDFTSVTYGAGGSDNTNKTAEIASYILNGLGVEALAHLTCVGTERESVSRTLDEFYDKGIRNILALRGDLPENARDTGSYRYAAELIREISGRGQFCVGAACYPEGHIDCGDAGLEIDYMLRKQEAGAAFLITQLCFDNATIFRFLEKARNRGVSIPISIGVMPILGRSQIERMVFLCGASLPSDIIKLLHKYENNPAELKKAGIEHAASQLLGLLGGGVDGVHIYTMNKPEIAEGCMKRMGRL